MTHPTRRTVLLSGLALLAGCAGPVDAPTPGSPDPAASEPTASDPTASEPAAAEPTASGCEDLIAALRAAGVALYLRHPATDRGGVDDAHAPREQQRLLSAEGERQARDWGATFEHHGITAGRVLTSPSWRCRDAADLAFGRHEVDWGIQALLQDTGTRPEREAYARDLLAEPVPEGQVLVLVGHSSNIAAATGRACPRAVAWSSGRMAGVQSSSAH